MFRLWFQENEFWIDTSQCDKRDDSQIIAAVHYNCFIPADVDLIDPVP